MSGYFGDEYLDGCEMDPREGFDLEGDNPENWAEYEDWLDEVDTPPEEGDDSQPSEYDEWQDVYGGDDWDNGQYDHYDEW